MGTGKGNENIPWIYRGIDFQTLGKQIKKYRVLRGLRQSDLAELIFSTTNTISRIEIGGIGCSLENLLRIADALEVSPDALLFGNFNPMYSRFYPYFWDMKEEILPKKISQILKRMPKVGSLKTTFHLNIIKSMLLLLHLWISSTLF